MSISERFQGANIVDAGRLSPYWGEHSARYVFAQNYVGDKSVLDIACGTGYGISLLSRNASYVAGVDIDPVAAKSALEQSPSNAGVLLGNGIGLPFADSTFDIVTSFETLEHLNERTAFVAELHRVIRSGGQLILSTPNANYSQPINGKPSNPFHVYEYPPEELRDELSRLFDVEIFVGQSLDRSTGIPPFFDAQQRLSGDLGTQVRLYGWKVFNKIPFAVREKLSEMIWNKPFYPTEMDYNFEEAMVETAPTLVAVCRKK